MSELLGPKTNTSTFEYGLDTELSARVTVISTVISTISSSTSTVTS